MLARLVDGVGKVEGVDAFPPGPVFHWPEPGRAVPPPACVGAVPTGPARGPAAGRASAGTPAATSAFPFCIARGRGRGEPFLGIACSNATALPVLYAGAWLPASEPQHGCWGLRSPPQPSGLTEDAFGEAAGRACGTRADPLIRVARLVRAKHVCWRATHVGFASFATAAFSRGRQRVKPASWVPAKQGTGRSAA